MKKLKIFLLELRLMNIDRNSYASWDWREVAASIFVVAVIAGGYLYFVG